MLLRLYTKIVYQIIINSIRKCNFSPVLFGTVVTNRNRTA